MVLPLETEPTEPDLAVEEEIPEAYKQILDLSRNYTGKKKINVIICV